MGGMMRIRRAGLAVSAFVCLAALCLLGVPSALAQSAGTGAISGTVTDPSNRSVPNATVTVTNVGTGQTRTATTGTGGDYKFSLLPPGTYRLKFSAAGFKTSTVPSVTVNTTETATADQTLQVGAVSESVTVEANVETLQTESSTLGTTVSGNTDPALPMANGNYTEILSLSGRHYRGRGQRERRWARAHKISARMASTLARTTSKWMALRSTTSPTQGAPTTAPSTPEFQFRARTPSRNSRSRLRLMTRAMDATPAPT